MENKILRKLCKGKELIPVTMKHETKTYGKGDHFISTKNPVDPKWLLNEFNKMSKCGIECKIEDGVLWRREPDYIYSSRTKQKWYL